MSAPLGAKGRTAMSDSDGLISAPAGRDQRTPAAASTATSPAATSQASRLAIGRATDCTVAGLGERVGEFRGGAEPVGRRLGERAGDRPLHRLGHGLPDGPDPGHRLDHAPGNDRLGGRAGVRRLAGEHLVEHAAEGVDVGAAVDERVGGRLFGAHVVRRAEGESGLGQAVAATRWRGPARSRSRRRPPARRRAGCSRA